MCMLLNLMLRLIFLNVTSLITHSMNILFVTSLTWTEKQVPGYLTFVFHHVSVMYKNYTKLWGGGKKVDLSFNFHVVDFSHHTFFLCQSSLV